MKVVPRGACPSPSLPCSVPSLRRYASLLLQPASPPYHMQRKSLKLLVYFCVPSYSLRKSPHMVRITYITGTASHQIPVILLHMVSLQQQQNNCARESRYNAPTIDMEHICEDTYMAIQYASVAKRMGIMQHPRSYCNKRCNNIRWILLLGMSMGEIDTVSVMQACFA